MTHGCLYVVEPAGRQVVHRRNVAALSEESVDEVGTYKTGSARYDAACTIHRVEVGFNVT